MYTDCLLYICTSKFSLNAELNVYFPNNLTMITPPPPRALW
jgi:hypothetical protein